LKRLMCQRGAAQGFGQRAGAKFVAVERGFGWGMRSWRFHIRRFRFFTVNWRSN
jgi:hypothetical protein